MHRDVCFQSSLRASGVDDVDADDDDTSQTVVI